MGLLYKPDWEETKDRFLRWWKHDYYGRCGLAVYAPKDNPSDIEAPEPPASIEQKWFDLDWISKNNEYTLSRTFYGGEAYPIWNAGYAGMSTIPTFIGCPTEVNMTTAWWQPILMDPDSIDFRNLRIDTENEYYVFTMNMLKRAAQESRGKSIPSIGAFGGSGDSLAALRGTEQLLFDCMERPEEVLAAEEYLMDMWFEFYDTCYEIIRESAEGSTCWFPFWSPGKFYAVHNDFSYNIGTKMFEEIFLPSIKRWTEFLDDSVYHVDGVEAFRHVEVLCELPRLQAFQIAPGTGKPSPLYYMDTLKLVQKKGKNLQISIAPGEIETALNELSARGLFISTACATETEARDLLKAVEKWSVDRG